MKPLATVYRLRIEAAGEPPGPWFWYWVDCDDRGHPIGDPSEPYRNETAAAEAAKLAGRRLFKIRSRSATP